MLELLKALLYKVRLIFVCDAFWKLQRGRCLVIGRRVSVRPSKHIRLGNNVFIGNDVTITTSNSGKSPIEIGDSVLLAEKTMVIGGNHRFDCTDLPMIYQGEGKQGPIIIEDDVWIGAGCIVLSGVTIGRGSVIGAGSIVVKSIPDYSVAVGNPCKVVKKREKSPEQMVSVIMPTYNHGKFIAESIESVLDQTYRNLELIIVDNYSDDNTEEIVRSYNDERIQYFKFHNKGVIAAARNFGLKKISGDYVAFLDSDDIWHNNKLEKQIPHFHDTDIIGVATNFTVISDTPYYRNLNLPKSRKGYIDFNYRNILNVNHLVTSSIVVRRNVLEQVGFFDENKDFCFIEDWELWLRMARSGSFRIFEQPLLSYRVFGKKNRKSYQVAKRYLKILDKHVGLGFVKPSELAEPKASIYLHIASKLLEFDQKQSRKYYKEAFVNTLDIRKKVKSAVGMFICGNPEYSRKFILLFLYKTDKIFFHMKEFLWKTTRGLSLPRFTKRT